MCQQLYCSTLCYQQESSHGREVKQTRQPAIVVMFVCVRVSISEHSPVCACLWVCTWHYFQTNLSYLARRRKWKPVLSQFLVKDNDVTWFEKIDGSPRMLIMSLWSLMILICICLPGNNTMLWSNVMLFCSFPSG